MLPVLFGFLRSESASRRKYGDVTEKKWIARFRAAAPPDWYVEMTLRSITWVTSIC